MFSAWGVFIRDYETFKCVSYVFVKKIHDSADIWGLFNLAHIRPTTENLKQKTKKNTETNSKEYVQQFVFVESSICGLEPGGTSTAGTAPTWD